MEQTGLPISIAISSADVHDSAKLIGVMENISEFLDDCTIKEIVSVYADRGYDGGTIRNYLKNRNIRDCIPFRKNSSATAKNKSYKKYNSIRHVAERFLAWLKNGFDRTRIRYERNAERCVGLLNIASFLMYCRVLRCVDHMIKKIKYGNSVIQYKLIKSKRRKTSQITVTLDLINNPQKWSLISHLSSMYN